MWFTDEGLAGVQATPSNATVLIRLAAGADEANRSELKLIGFEFEGTRVPAKVDNLKEAEGFPLALAVLAVIGLATVGHALATSPRRRRRDFAALRTLGFVPRQLGATLAVQATAVTAVGLVVGLPVGIAAGGASSYATARGVRKGRPARETAHRKHRAGRPLGSGDPGRRLELRPSAGRGGSSGETPRRAGWYCPVVPRAASSRPVRSREGHAEVTGSEAGAARQAAGL